MSEKTLIHYKGQTEQDAHFHYPPCWREPREESYEGHYDVQQVNCRDCLFMLAKAGHPDLYVIQSDETQIVNLKMQFEDNLLTWRLLTPGRTACEIVLRR